MTHRNIDKKLREKRQIREKKSRWRRLRPRRNDSETTRQYTPRDVQAMTDKPRNGVMRPETGALLLPPGAEDFDDSQQTTSPPRVMIVIVTLALLFIAIIAYFVSRMPAKE